MAFKAELGIIFISFFLTCGERRLNDDYGKRRSLAQGHIAGGSPPQIDVLPPLVYHAS
jgi:hypothetical protein